jgi:predicted transcriptional regulator
MITNDASLLRVLKIFTEKNDIGFTDIAHTLGFGTDLTGYYLRKLQNKDLIEKRERGVYRITPLGKSVVAHSAQLSASKTIPRISIMIIARFGDEFVIVRRDKQPFIGTHEWPTFALETGVDMARSASNALFSRLGIEGTPKLQGFFRRIDTHKDIIFDDKVFAVHSIDLSVDLKSDVVIDSPLGALSFVTALSLKTMTHASRSLIDILEFHLTNKTYAEATYELQSEDLYTPLE